MNRAHLGRRWCHCRDFDFDCQCRLLMHEMYLAHLEDVHFQIQDSLSVD